MATRVVLRLLKLVSAKRESFRAIKAPDLLSLSKVLGIIFRFRSETFLVLGDRRALIVNVWTQDWRGVRFLKRLASLFETFLSTRLDLWVFAL